MAGKNEWRRLWDALQQSESDPLESLGEVEAVAKSLLLSSVKEDNRRAVTHDDVSLLKTILKQLIAECSTTVSLSWRPDVVGTLTSVLKLMRNLCAGVPLNQEMMLRAVTHDDVSLLKTILEQLIAECSTTMSLSWRPDVVGTLTSVLKLMRNLCAGVPLNQEMILEGDTIDQVVTLSSSVASLESPKAVVMVQAGLQLLGNVCVKCAEGQERVWQLCFPNNFKTLMQQGSTDVANVCCMVLHTCTCENSTLRNQLCSSPAGGDVIAQVLSCLATSDQSEWMVYLLESLTSSTPLESLWETLEKHSRAKITLLSFIATGLADFKDIGSQSDSSLLPKVLNEQNLTFLVGSFQRQSQLLLSDNAAPLNVTFAAKTTDLGDPNVILVQVTMETLRLICMFGEREQWLMVLQQHLAVCDTALALLRQLASLDGSDVSARHRSRLSSVQPTGDEYQCPTFGLKRLLVQLIGHLCYRSPLVQDKIREDDAIPLILNQCSIDHHNPYITQWAVLAIRNLCEGNTTNQELIASLECKGVEKTQPLLAELGCEVEIGDDGKIKVKNVKQK